MTARQSNEHRAIVCLGWTQLSGLLHLLSLHASAGLDVVCVSSDVCGSCRAMVGRGGMGPDCGGQLLLVTFTVCHHSMVILLTLMLLMVLHPPP